MSIEFRAWCRLNRVPAGDAAEHKGRCQASCIAEGEGKRKQRSTAELARRLKPQRIGCLSPSNWRLATVCAETRRTRSLSDTSTLTTLRQRGTPGRNKYPDLAILWTPQSLSRSGATSLSHVLRSHDRPSQKPGLLLWQWLPGASRTPY